MKIFRYTLVGLIIGIPLLGWVVVAHAQSFRSGDNITVPANTTVNNTLFAAGKTIDIAGTVNGDVFCAGQNVTVSGTVNGDVICAGQSVSVSGTVSGDVRLAGQNVTIGGSVDGNATIAGQTLATEARSKIAGDISAGGQDVTLNGPVGRDVAVGGTTVILNSTIGRNVQATVQDLTLGNSARIGGNVTYTSDNTLTKNKGAEVTGSVSRSAPKHGNAKPGAIIGVSLLMAAYMIVALLLLMLVLTLLIPRALHVAAETARHNMLRTFLIGLVASVMVPLILLALLFTVVAIPLALFGLLVWLVITLLSGPFAAYLTGRLILQNTGVNNAIWTGLLGALVLLLLYLVPFVGALVALLALWFGLGTILQRAYYHIPRPHYDMSKLTEAVANEPPRRK